MLDFKALMDPEVQAELRAQREVEQAKQEAQDKKIRELVDRCMEHIETLPERDRSLVRSCRHLIITSRAVSAAQEKWLRDIISRLPS